jgi:hypothetical protein
MPRRHITTPFHYARLADMLQPPYEYCWIILISRYSQSFQLSRQVITGQLPLPPLITFRDYWPAIRVTTEYQPRPVIISWLAGWYFRHYAIIEADAISWQDIISPLLRPLH